MSVQAQIVVDFSSNTVCSGSLTTLSSLSTTSSGNITEYHWDLDNDGVFDDATDSTFLFDFNLATTVSVGLQVITDAPDTNFLYQNVNFLVGPSASFNASTACAKSNTVFLNTSSSGDLFLWNFGDGTSTIHPTPLHTYQNGAVYNVTLVALDTLNLCTDTFVATVTVRTLPVVNIVLLGDTIICPDNGAKLVAQASIPHFWSTGENSDTIEITQQGMYYLVAADSFACIGKDSVFISMNAAPNLSVSLDTFIVLGNSVVLTTSGAATYVWSTSSSSNIGTTASITVSPTVTTTYHIEGLSLVECSATDSVRVRVYENYWMDYINTITPNGDEKNDFFYLRNDYIFDQFFLNIFNSWGQSVFSGSAQDKWDGTVNGKKVPADTYYFTLTRANNANLSFQGTIYVLE